MAEGRRQEELHRKPTGSRKWHYLQEGLQLSGPGHPISNWRQKKLQLRNCMIKPLTFQVEPMTCPLEVVHPIPSTSSQMADVPTNFSTKLNKVAKMKTGPICYKAKLVNALTTRPRVIFQRLPLEDLQAPL